ncbi:MAG: hypothetical protein HFJ20_01110 [Clostridia bacterium]|nr:hypothetical protein [Clostridia bacterium]
MEKNQKKKIPLIIIIIVLVIFITTGILVYLFTDLFKSDKQLFYKYLLDENEMFSILDEFKLKQDINSYVANTNIQTIYEYDDRIEKLENDQIIKNLKENIQSFEYLNNLHAMVESRVDKQNKKQFHDIQLNKNDNKIMQIDIVRNEDIYALKAEEILKAYIGIENKNIKELASKFDLQNARGFSK